MLIYYYMCMNHYYILWLSMFMGRARARARPHPMRGALSEEPSADGQSGPSDGQHPGPSDGRPQGPGPGLGRSNCSYCWGHSSYSRNTFLSLLARSWENKSCVTVKLLTSEERNYQLQPCVDLCLFACIATNYQVNEFKCVFVCAQWAIGNSQ